MKQGNLVSAGVRIGVVLGCLGGPAWGATDKAALPDSERLAPVRAALEKTIDQAARDGLPVELIVSKVREGVAKGIAPEAIRAAADRLAQSLGAADRLLKVQRKGVSSPALLRAVADAQTAVVELDAVVPVVAANAPDPMLARAVEVLTDLALRGYPSRRAALVVREVTDRDAAALGRLVAGVEEIRTEQTVSRADALEALGRNIATGGASFDSAMARALEGGDRAGNASPSAPGKSGQAPGHQGGSGASKSQKPKK
jgi:hypothetical protein